ncbi:MAG: hypothetical protein ABI970_20285 [Chloroflexota bacterium]
MRRIFVLAMFLSVLSLKVAQANAQAQPLYAVAFPHDNHVSVATLMDDQTWRLRTFDNSYFGKGDFSYIDPVWSPDGKTLYITAFPEDDTDTARAIYSYDITSDQYNPVVVLPKLDRSLDWAQIEGLSTDGRYMRLSRSMNSTADWVDLQSPQHPQIIPQNSDCPTRMVSWQPSYLITYQYLCGNIGIQIWDAHTGKLKTDLSGVDSDRLNYGSYDQWVEINLKPSYLLAASSYDLVNENIVRVDPETGKETTLSQGGSLFVSRDQDFAAFIKDQRLMRLDLATGKIQDTGAADKMSQVLGTDGDDLQLWNVLNTPEQTRISQITLTKTARTDADFYTVSPTPAEDTDIPGFIRLAPRTSRFSLSYNDAKGNPVIQIYDGNKLLFSDKDVASPSKLEKNNYWQMDWSADAKWYFQPISVKAGDDRTLGIDLDTGKTTLLPEAGSYLITASPDDTWWLYTVLKPDQLQNDAGFQDPLEAPIIAFNHVTGEKVALGGSGFISFAIDGRNQRYIQDNFYIWSPSAHVVAPH